MGRIITAIWAFVAVCQAAADEELQESSGTLAPWEDSEKGTFFDPTCVGPYNDTCCINCYSICGSNMNDGIIGPPKGCGSACGQPPPVSSERYCQEACWAHSIETTTSKGELQGMYVQKVITQYCARGLCPSSLLAEVEKHEHKQTKTTTTTGYNPYPAAASGWPSTCATQSFYCSQLCENMYHEPTEPLGPHPGGDSNWQKNRATCIKNCGNNFDGLKQYFDTVCSCIAVNGTSILPSRFLQEQKQEHGKSENVDVGSFIQMPGERKPDEL